MVAIVILAGEASRLCMTKPGKTFLPVYTYNYDVKSRKYTLQVKGH